MKLVYTVDAVEDLARLREFIEANNPVVAQRIAAKLLDDIAILTAHPEIGRPVLRAPDPEVIRDLVTGDYLARYTLYKNTIVILRIWHHREDRKSMGLESIDLDGQL